MTDPKDSPERSKRPGGFRRYAFLALCGLVIVSVAARAVIGSSEPESKPAPAVSSTTGKTSSELAPDSLLPGEQDFPGFPGTTTTPEGETGTTGGGVQTTEPSTAETLLPYVTEGSFFALIGFALGYASKKVLKLGLIVLAVFFVALQGLSYLDVITIDWKRAIDVVNDLILNLNENRTVLDFVKDRVPTLGGFGVGYLLGFRRG